MKAEQINPFVTSTVNVFKTMADMDVRRKELKINTDPTTEHDVTAVISMQGVLTGSVALSFPEEVALQIAGKFAMCEFTEICDDVADAIAEMVNMIAGGAKADLAKAGVPAQLAIPQVVLGSNHTIYYPPDIPIVQVAFVYEGNEFTLDVCIKEVETDVAEAMATAGAEDA